MEFKFPLGVFRATKTCIANLPGGRSIHMAKGDTLDLTYVLRVEGALGALVRVERQPRRRRKLVLC